MMRRGAACRKAVLGILFALFTIFTLNRIYDGRSNHLPSFGNGSQIPRKACRIWNDWDASDRPSLRYDEYDTRQAQRLSVGETKVLGNPGACLKAGSRLDIYRTAPTDAHDWNSVQWGKNLCDS